MIKTIEYSNNSLILKDYPAKHWLAFICLTIFIILFNYQALFNKPIYSALNCYKEWSNSINYEPIESALFKPDLRHKTIKNIRSPKRILKNGTIWLNTEIDLLHNRIKNNYYPSSHFFGFFSVYLYRFHEQALQEVKQIENFIHNKKIFPTKQKL